MSRLCVDILSQIQLCQWQRLLTPTTHHPPPAADCQCKDLQKELFVLLNLLWLKSSLTNLAHVPKLPQLALLGLI